METHGEQARFGANLRALRRRQSLTQQELARRAGVDRATISQIENGRENPRTDTVLRLARVLGVGPADLWAGPAPGSGAHGEEGEGRLREHAALRYEPVERGELHPGLRELLEDDRTRLMLGITPEEEAMLRSIRTRREAPLGRDFFVDVLISFRRHQQE
jgi:transcriptional regulator with XRE-family HTH domain